MITVDKINAEIDDVIAHGNNRQDVAYLADLLTCRAGLPAENTQIGVIQTSGTGSEFIACVNGKCYTDVLSVMDELMQVLEATNPRLYNGVMQKLQV